MQVKLILAEIKMKSWIPPPNFSSSNSPAQKQLTEAIK